MAAPRIKAKERSLQWIIVRTSHSVRCSFTRQRRSEITQIPVTQQTVEVSIFSVRCDSTLREFFVGVCSPVFLHISCTVITRETIKNIINIPNSIFYAYICFTERFRSLCHWRWEWTANQQLLRPWKPLYADTASPSESLRGCDWHPALTPTPTHFIKQCKKDLYTLFIIVPTKISCNCPLELVNPPLAKALRKGPGKLGCSEEPHMQLQMSAAPAASQNGLHSFSLRATTPFEIYR